MKMIKNKRWIIDIIGVVSVILFAIFVMFHVYSRGLCIRYKDATGARQFMQAAQIAQGTYQGSGLSVIAYIEALFIRVASIFVSRAGWYQAFIISEMVLRVVEVVLFYGVVRSYGKSVMMRIITPILTILYFGGYPAMSVLWGNYGYWNGNAVLVLLFLLLIRLVEQKWKNKEFVQYFTGGAVVVFFLVYYAVFLNQARIGVPEQTTLEGMFRNIYGDVIFFAPILMFVVLNAFHKRREGMSIALYGIAMAAAAVVIYVQWYQQSIDGYYYYLNLYNVWLSGWILTAAAIRIAVETRQIPAIASYAAMYLVILSLVLGGFDQHMWNHNPNYNNAYSTTNLCAVYRQTLEALLTDYEQYEYDVSRLENFAETVQNEDESEKLAIITSDEATQYWFDGVTGANSKEYRLDKKEFPDIMLELQKQGIERLVVSCDSSLEGGQTDIYLDYFEKNSIEEKEGMLICEAQGTGWTDVETMYGTYDDEKCELFELAADGGQYEGVPLLADKTSYVDYIMYRNITEKSMQDFYTWHYSPVDNINHLNEQGIHYIIVLYDDTYYRQTQPYFETQTIVFQNAAGCVMTHDGELWTTSY